MGISISAESKKLNKKQAYDVVTRLAEGETVERENIEGLLLYFAPGLPKKAKDAFTWDAKAAAKEDVRKFLEYVYVENGMAYASDGHRLHRAPVDLENGYYDTKTRARVDIDQKPPRFEEVFTPLKDAKTLTYKASEADRQVIARKKFLLFNDFDDQPKALNENYAIDALNGETDGELTIENNAKQTRFRGESEFGAFVIMSARV